MLAIHERGWGGGGCIARSASRKTANYDAYNDDLMPLHDHSDSWLFRITADWLATGGRLVKTGFIPTVTCAFN